MSGRVCVVGSLNIDIVSHVHVHPRPGETVAGDDLIRMPGGKGANQALAAVRAGASTSLVGRIGDDDIGKSYVRGLQDRGIDCHGVQFTPGISTGHALVVIDAGGENSIVVVPGANASMRPADVDRYGDEIRHADILLVQLELPQATTLRAIQIARDSGVRVILNASPWGSATQEMIDYADPIVLNEHEAKKLAGGAETACVTLGSRGARWGEDTEPAVRVPVVDTAGAGDAFTGALAAALAVGANRRVALAVAVAAGAEACRHSGAQGWSL